MVTRAQCLLFNNVTGCKGSKAVMRLHLVGINGLENLAQDRIAYCEFGNSTILIRAPHSG